MQGERALTVVFGVTIRVTALWAHLHDAILGELREVKLLHELTDAEFFQGRSQVLVDDGNRVHTLGSTGYLLDKDLAARLLA